MRAARARPMPGSFSSSSAEAVLILRSRVAPSSFKDGTDAIWLVGGRLLCGSLTQAAGERANRELRKAVRRRGRFICGSRRFRSNRSLKRNRKKCSRCVQNARSLKFSETCNLKMLLFHRLFHRNCGKVSKLCHGNTRIELGNLIIPVPVRPNRRSFRKRGPVQGAGVSRLPGL
jgi:hypothetical protein